MKKGLILLLSIVLLFSGCASNNNIPKNIEFTAQPIVKTVGNIEVIIDPNVEMMNILGRIAQLTPYKKKDVDVSKYTDDVDKWFSDYKSCKAASILKSNNVCYQRVPELGMYLNPDVSNFIYDLNDEKFVVSDGRANQISYYSRHFVNAVREFRIKSDFDSFFNSNIDYYNMIIDLKIRELKGMDFDKWMVDFYKIDNDNKLCLYLTDLSGNYGISFIDQQGNTVPHAVVLSFTAGTSFMLLVSHEFSHPLTRGVVRELYSYPEVSKVFNNLYAKYSSTYNSMGYPSGLLVLNETLNQACANKFLEKAFPSGQLNYLYNWVKNTNKMVYTEKITDFLSIYENNRHLYPELKDFIPELRDFIKTLK